MPTPSLSRRPAFVFSLPCRTLLIALLAGLAGPSAQAGPRSVEPFFSRIVGATGSEQRGIVNPAVLEVRPGSRRQSPRAIEFSLPGSISLLGTVEGIRRPARSDCLWVGRTDEEPRGWFLFVVHGDTVAGEISSSASGHFHIRPTENGEHEVLRVAGPDRLDCLTGLEHEVRTAGGSGKAPRIDSALRGSILIDVLFVYTASSRAAVGGTAAMEAILDGHIGYVNQIANPGSGVHHRFRLVHAAEVPYVESGNALTDLARLKNPGDGFLDEVHPLRDEFGADLVSLVNTSGSAGVAYMMATLSTAFESCAFSAIGHTVGGLVFAHEAGHNMGCAHNNGPGAPATIFCYSFGHRTANGRFRTIMSNPPAEFVDRFSSPDLSIDGMPLGVSGNGCPPDAAHNVLSLNNAAATVASFRDTVVPEGGGNFQVPAAGTGGIVALALAVLLAGIAARKRVAGRPGTRR